MALFERFGEADYIGEPVSITQHSLQAAALAQEAVGDPEVTVAALLHDMGHAIGLEAGQSMEMEGCGVVDHEGLGSDMAKKLGFSSRIQKLVANHVNAKRFLCAEDPSYHASLSAASQTTLRHQGGPMSDGEVAQFKADPDFDLFLLMRSWDEAAKIPNAQVPDFESYAPLLDAHSSLPADASYMLSAAQLEFYNANQFLKLPNLLEFDGTSADEVSAWVDEVAAWEPAENKWLLHHEMTDNGKQMCRAENFVNYHQGLSRLSRELLQGVVAQVWDEAALLFKEKINYKLAGGEGFSAHQDTPAYIGMGQDKHVSVMVAVDESTLENGCLQVAPGKWAAGKVPLTKSGIVEAEAEKMMTFVPAPCKPGEVVLFSGWIPHRSSGNTSKRHRRAMFLTYNPLSAGDHHAAYYKAKHDGLQGFASGKTLSFQGDFNGKIV